MDFFPIKINAKGSVPAVVAFAIIGLFANLLLLVATAAAIGFGLRIGLGL